MKHKLLILFFVLSIAISLALCTGNQKFESKEAKIVKLMDSDNLVTSIQKLGDDRFLLRSMNASVKIQPINASSTNKTVKFEVRFCRGGLEVVRFDRTNLSVVKEWNKTLKSRVFSYPCITDLNGDGRKDILVAIEDDANHYENATELVVFVSKNGGYEERRIAVIEDFFVCNVSLVKFDGREDILLTGFNPKKGEYGQGRVMVLEGKLKVREYRLGNRTLEAIPADLDKDGRPELIVYWSSLQNSAFVSVFDYPDFKEVERIKLPLKRLTPHAIYRNGNLFILGLKGLYVLNLQNHDIKEVYRPSKSEYTVMAEVKKGNPTLLIYNESDWKYPYKILKLREDAMGYHEVSEIKLNLKPVLSIDFDELLIGSSKGLYLAEI